MKLLPGNTFSYHKHACEFHVSNYNKNKYNFGCAYKVCSTLSRCKTSGKTMRGPKNYR